jgi:drug/metabolite transporter (DMT)-like permease
MRARLRGAWPMLAIMLGASVLGIIWYPMRILAALGLSATAASALTSAAACLTVATLRRDALRSMSWHWLLAALGLAAGVTSVGFIWGAIHGQVMRVLLLFYLSPAWTALFAHFILRERLSRAGAALAALSLAGAAVMLWSPELGLPLPANAAEWAGLVAGMGFAMSNVLALKISRVMPGLRAEVRTATIFGGAAIVATVIVAFEACLGSMPVAAAVSRPGVMALLVVGIGAVLASNNVLVQVGLTRMPANRASIIMLFELVVTALSAWLLAGEVPGAREWAGGACIVVACALSSWVHRSPGDATNDPEDINDACDADDASARKSRRAMV